MKIDFANHNDEEAVRGEADGTYLKLKKVIERKLGKKSLCATDDVMRTLDKLAAAPSCFDLPPSIHPHPLDGNMKGCFAVDIKVKGGGGRGKYRMVFEPVQVDGDPELRLDNYKTIKSIVIKELCIDYHR